MSRPMISRGMLIMALGLVTIIASSVIGILNASAQLYLDLQSYELDLNQGGDIPFTQPEKKKISFWLKQPNRTIEGKNFAVTIRILGADKEFKKGFRRDLQFKTTRHDLVDGHYYKLGSYRFGAGFKGFVSYAIDGAWRPDSSPTLLLRTNKKTTFSTAQIIAVIAGGLMLVIGLGVLMRDTSS